jgi:formylmethanofuran dehydrogenase subunit A
LELALLIKDSWKIFMTTDHPNGGPFTSYPKIIAWLMSRKARQAAMKRLNPRAQSKSLLPSIDRELDFYEVATVTRAGQAKALGLTRKGHLGVGADADIAIYGINPEKIDPAQKFKTLRRAFRRAAFTIKDGKVLVANGKVLKHVDGRTMWLDIRVSEQRGIADDLKQRFREYWTVEYENYPVNEACLKDSHRIDVQARV